MRTALKKLCERALAGDAGLEEIHNEVVEERLQPFPLLKTVFDDLVDAVEHTPGSLLTGRIDRAVWVRSPERAVLLLDALLLESDLPLPRLAACRDRLLKLGEFADEQLLREQVRRCVG